MHLAHPFAFPLGGPGLSGGVPWVVNLVPSADQQNIRLLKPIRFSIRDSETYIDPASIRVKAGYAKVFSNADSVFDSLPRTKRIALAEGLAGEPDISIVSGNVQIERTSDGPQRSVYATSVAAGNGYTSAMLTAVVRPDSLTPYDDVEESSPLLYSVFPGPILPLPYSPLEAVSGVLDNGTIIGLEHGPRNKVVYLRFQEHSDGTRIVRLTSFAMKDGTSPIINSSIIFDWSSLRRYIIVWNENEGYLEIYGQVALTTERLFRILLSSIPAMPAGYFIKAGTATDITALYGQLGDSGDQSTWANIAITTDVGYPVLGNIRPGTFVTSVKGAEIITTLGNKDPREDELYSWFITEESVMPDLDGAATVGVDNNKFKITKVTLGKTYSFYREEPAFLASNSEGFMIDAKISVDSKDQSGAATGTGITIYDGQSVFQLQLFNDSGVKTIGLLKRLGDDSDITEYFLPSTPIDWSAQHRFKFVVDPRRNAIRLYDGDDLSTAVMDIPLDRNTIPTGTDFDWDGLTPFIIFGHTMPTSTLGTFILEKLVVSHIHQSWDAEDGVAPSVAPTNPIYARTTSGSSTVSMATGDLVITTSTGALDKFHRTAFFGANRGAIIEARLKINSWRPKTKTGLYLILDDAVRSYALSFVDTNIGKFVVLAKRDSLGGFQEVAGRDGDAATISFLFDWSAFHTYRMERRPYDGVRIYVDDETDPRIIYPESKITLLPDPVFAGTPTIAFGQFGGIATTSTWKFVRGTFSRGYEISFKKNKSDIILRNELINTQAIVVAHALDND